jgi:hypothetical protein
MVLRDQEIDYDQATVRHADVVLPDILDVGTPALTQIVRECAALVKRRFAARHEARNDKPLAFQEQERVEFRPGTTHDGSQAKLPNIRLARLPASVPKGFQKLVDPLADADHVRGLGRVRGENFAARERFIERDGERDRNGHPRVMRALCPRCKKKIKRLAEIYSEILAGRRRRSLGADHTYL